MEDNKVILEQFYEKVKTLKEKLATEKPQPYLVTVETDVYGAKGSCDFSTSNYELKRYYPSLINFYDEVFDFSCYSSDYDYGFEKLYEGDIDFLDFDLSEALLNWDKKHKSIVNEIFETLEYVVNIGKLFPESCGNTNHAGYDGYAKDVTTISIVAGPLSEERHSKVLQTLHDYAHLSEIANAPC